MPSYERSTPEALRLSPAYQAAHTQDGALTSVCRYRQRQLVYAASGYRGRAFSGSRGELSVEKRPSARRGSRNGPGGPYPASPRMSRMAAPDNAAFGMKAKAGLAETNSAKSSSAWVEIKIVRTAPSRPFP